MVLTVKPSSIVNAGLALFSSRGDKSVDRPALFVGDSLDAWLLPEGAAHKGLLVKRSFDGAWDGLVGEIDGATSRFGDKQAIQITVQNAADKQQLESRMLASVDKLLAVAKFSPKLSDQIRSDACAIGCTVGQLLPMCPELELKLEIFGENVCSRWHQDHFVGRAITSYTGALGTEYTDDSNINFWELKHCGNNECIIYNKEKIKNVAVGDMIFIKGTKCPGVSGSGLVHRSPDKRFHEDGRIVNRLVLKVDVMSTGGKHPLSAAARPQIASPRAVKDEILSVS